MNPCHPHTSFRPLFFSCPAPCLRPILPSLVPDYPSASSPCFLTAGSSSFQDSDRSSPRVHPYDCRQVSRKLSGSEVGESEEAMQVRH
eukprot:765376-Hanusia_phi.AAC.5